jgi:hypothetical protein
VEKELKKQSGIARNTGYMSYRVEFRVAKKEVRIFFARLTSTSKRNLNRFTATYQKF